MQLPWLAHAYKQFKDSYLNNKMSGSIIIEGTYGKGAYHLVHDIVKLYMCSNANENGPCNKCKSCQLINEGSHLDVEIILSTKTQDESAITDNLNVLYKQNELGTVRIDNLRAISSFLHESSVINDKKVVVIQNAHLMKEQGANSILKTFEEPPLNRLIILVTKSFSLLLPTILSRAIKLSIENVSLDVARDFLYQNNIKKEDIDIALALSFNSPLQALNLSHDIITIDKQDYTFVDIVKNILNLFMLYLKTRDENLIDFLSNLAFDKRMLILHEIVLEILKLKARVSVNDLALISNIKEHELFLRQNLKMRSLFNAHKFLLDLEIAEKNIPSQASKANLREFFRILMV